MEATTIKLYEILCSHYKINIKTKKDIKKMYVRAWNPKCIWKASSCLFSGLLELQKASVPDLVIT